MLDSVVAIGRELLAPFAALDDALSALARAAARVVSRPAQLPTTAGASTTQIRDGVLVTVGSTGELARGIDARQRDLGSGPALDALAQDGPIRSNQLSSDPRWPEFGVRAAADTGVHSVLCVRIHVADDELVAGMNLYSTEPNAFTRDDEAALQLLATHGALALAAALRRQEVEHLRAALATNRTIGTAVGVLMTSELLTQDQAFGLLRIASQHSNRKVVDIAQEIVDTGSLEAVVRVAPNASRRK
jgi:GAF domain-containing protein